MTWDQLLSVSSWRPFPVHLKQAPRTPKRPAAPTPSLCAVCPSAAPEDTAGRSDSASTLHPGHDASSAEIVAHLVSVHHRAITGHLQRIESVLGIIDSGRLIAPLFAQLRSGLCDCLRTERGKVFPHFEFAQRGDHPVQPLLRESVRAIERSHARSLVTLWKLLSLARNAAAEDREKLVLVVELAALSEEYYQHLFEVECLLFPRLISTCSAGRVEKSVPISAAATA
jgi:hypothetical protein